MGGGGVLTSEFRVAESFLKFLFIIEETASSISPTKLSSFDAISERKYRFQMGKKDR